MRAALWATLLILLLGDAAAAQTQAAPSFQELFERHGAIMLLIEPDGGAIIDANPAAAHFYGYARDALRALTIQQINSFTPEQIAAERQLAQSEGRNFFIFRHRLAQGELRTVEVRSSPFLFDGRSLLLSIINDVTPQRLDAPTLWHYQSQLEEMVDAQVKTILAGERRLSQALIIAGAAQSLLILGLIVNIRRRRRSERRFRDVSEAAGEFIWESDAQGRLTFISDRVSAVMGFSPAQMLGRTLFEPEPGVPPHAFRGRRQPFQHQDGRELWLEINGLPQFNGRGALNGYRGAALDITETRRMEADQARMQAQQERSNAEMARLAEVMAHHFQEPTRRLVSFAQRLRRKPDVSLNDPDQQISVNFIESEARRLRDLVRDVQLYLAAGRTEPPDHPTDSLETLHAVLARLGAADASLEIGALPPVWVDAKRLHDLFSALLDNALRHRRKDRPVTLRISAECVYKRARFRFADNGPGVPTAYRDQVFRLFERLPIDGVDRLGSGVGLSVARRVVEAAGGRIRLEDGIDGGCAVVFDLPLEPPPAMSAPR